MNSEQLLFKIHDAIVSHNGNILINSFNWQVRHSECWWITGANNTGKTTLLEIIAGQQRLAEGTVTYYADADSSAENLSPVLIRRDFTLYHHFSSSASFYQQRFFSSGNEETPLVIDFISAETGITKDKIKEAAAEFHITELLDSHIVSLSTGEGCRILLLILWLTDRKIFLFDDPYSGLDQDGRELVTHIFEVLSGKGITILVTGTSTDHPAVFDHTLYIKDHHVAFAGRSEDFRQQWDDSALKPGRINLKSCIRPGYDYDFHVAAGMNDITVRYDTNTVLQSFSWTIRRGEKWLLTGKNGSGKSTLMSMIYADNPMAYACELVVFDKVRGSGETIWEIKSRMGYFSSELQQFFPRTFTLREAVLSGFSDHLTVRKDLTHDHLCQADELIVAAGLTSFADKPLYRLSFSICRLALVCRALVKHPPVVILDEPCQGLDLSAMQLVHELVGSVCGGENKTLIYVTNQADDVPGIIGLRKVLEM